MKKNFISILITNYNKSSYLKKSINSCLNQDFNNKEILVFDDCSTDDSLKILNKFKKIKVIKNKKKKFKSGPLNQIYGLNNFSKYQKEISFFCLIVMIFSKKTNYLKLIKFLKKIKKLILFRIHQLVAFLKKKCY